MRTHVSNRYFQYSHRRMETPPRMDFHLHDRFEVYIFITGEVNYLIEKKVYPLQYGDLLIMNNRELHKPTFRSDAVYENIVVHFDPAVADLWRSADDYAMLDCFVNRPNGEGNRIRLTPRQLDEALSICHRTEQLSRSSLEGGGLLLTAYMTELLVLVNQAFRQQVARPDDDAADSPPAAVHEKLAPVLDFIDRHPERDLSLEALEGLFFMNRYYLSRLFRRATGSTIHEYILLKRIARAKKLLQEGLSVTEACQLSGFNDYSNFIRMFKRFVGMPPGQYRKRECQP